jgi:Tol biopolymer transport system component
MMKAGRKSCRHANWWTAVVVSLTALLGVSVTSPRTGRAQDVTPTDSAGSIPVFGKPMNLGPIVNSPRAEWDPHISADGLSLYFNSRRAGGLGKGDIWVTTRKTKDDPWSTPINLGSPVNSSAHEVAPCLSGDGLELYFASDRSVGSGLQDIWVAKRKSKNDPWGPPVNLGPKVNSPVAENSPSLSADGLSLYFAETIWSTARPGGQGRADIWVTRRKTKESPWSVPVNLGPTVNSAGAECAPSISSDGLSLYFHRIRAGGSRKPDIWVTTRKTKDDPWGRPVKLGPPVNSSDQEYNPDISSDGSTLFFVSDRPGSVGGRENMDMWQVSLKPTAK